MIYLKDTTLPIFTFVNYIFLYIIITVYNTECIQTLKNKLLEVEKERVDAEAINSDMPIPMFRLNCHDFTISKGNKEFDEFMKEHSLNSSKECLDIF